MNLPKDIEEAITSLTNLHFQCGQHGGSTSEYSQLVRKTNEAYSRLCCVIIAHIGAGSAPTQRQRYKEAAMRGLLSNPAVLNHPAYDRDEMNAEAGRIADSSLTEDAEHAKKESNK